MPSLMGGYMWQEGSALGRRGQLCIYHLSDPLQTQVHQPPQLPVPLKVALVVALGHHKIATRKG